MRGLLLDRAVVDSVAFARGSGAIPAKQALGDPAGEAEDTEQMHADPKLDVIAPAEDEVTLELPMAAGREEGGCAAPSPKAQAGKRESPFDELAVLKRQCKSFN